MMLSLATIPLSRLITLALVAMILLAGGLVIAAIVAQWMGTQADARRDRNWARWEPMLLDMLAGERDPRSLGLMVTPRERLDFFRLIVAYALRLGGESRRVLAEAASLHLGAALELLSHPRADQRALAAHLVGLVGGPQERQRLRPLLWDPSLEVAMTVARALARSGDAVSRRLVIDALERFESWGAGSLAAMLALFGVRGGAVLQAALMDATRSDLARVSCAEALRRLVYVPAAEPAARVLAEDADREVRAAVLRLLRDIGGPGHADAIRPLCDHEDPVLRLHAISALSALSLSPIDAARIEYALRDESSWVSLRAARGLIESGRVASLQTVASGDAPEAAIARQALAEAGYSPAET
ncbi:HEAT repeat domain-containing protein [Rubricoccus marinus]|uniref:HEAT repeat domain-containing protein n=1 Tax=Rubricoccus marinus TaxID=716817 RepID=A0A259U1R3_9BACT|nr:HEAT repeat domain-containing protein [Rubricoccus marinus]OZC03876.1 hypothetical protein BSZ36_13305 [Rubricoccus marinus]